MEVDHLCEQLGVNALFPQDETGWPEHSKAGKYYVKLHCNGAARQVTIDDYFPINASNTPLCATLYPEQEFWPACLEKAVSIISCFGCPLTILCIVCEATWRLSDTGLVSCTTIIVVFSILRVAISDPSIDI